MASDDFPKKPSDFFDYAKKNQAEMVDLKFVDLLGSWQHCSFPIDHLDEGTFEEGLGFDGSSIRGWMGIHESDMMAVPVAETTRLDPFYPRATRSRTSDTSQASRAGISRSVPPTRSTICAVRWCTRCGRSASSSKRIITRSRRRDRPRSTCSSSRC